MSANKRLAHQVSATPPSPSHLAEAARRDSFTLASTAAASDAIATATGLPRTTEVLWNGAASLGFTLKRKRKSGAILVSTLQDSCASRVRVGSELKLVGGFPVKQLTLAEVKKVMLRAPKPVSLVFLNQDAVARAQLQQQQQPQIERRPLVASDSFLTDCSDDRGSFDNEFTSDELSPAAAAGFFDTAPVGRVAPLQRAMSADFALTAPLSSSRPARPLSPSAMSSASGFTASYDGASASQASKKRRVSKLRVALDRMSQLLNRPVRQSALNIPAAKSIVV
ncbi:hypothetical protein PybrP1_011794 [[Pythium] brassicae (nom. inval.)]|nr:hypothetical protein PybrP1_011794 [[Pythium] brassicae (nom. inval.)]